MVEAFVAFVRFEEKLLLMRRNKSDGDFPALWDGVWGVADTQEEVLERVSESTGLPVESLYYQLESSLNRFLIFIESSLNHQ